MPVNFIQPTFAAGEIAPSLYARVDLAKYHAACKLLRNFFIWAHGGVSNRAGTQFVGRAKDSANPVHLIPFQFNLLQTYVLEFGHLYMRVIMNGGYVLEPALPISSITQANPGVVSAGGQGSGANILCNLAGGVIVGVELISGGSGYQGNVTLTPIASSGSGAVLVPAIVDGVIQSVTIANGGSGYPESGSLLVQITQGHGFSNGDQVFIAGTDTPLDSTPGRQYLIANATQTTFTLTDLDGNPIDTTNTSNYIDGTVARVFTLTTPYDGADVQNIKWTQSADVLTLCHPLYPPQDLERTEHWVWTLDPISFAPQISAPANVFGIRRFSRLMEFCIRGDGSFRYASGGVSWLAARDVHGHTVRSRYRRVQYGHLEQDHRGKQVSYLQGQPVQIGASCGRHVRIHRAGDRDKFRGHGDRPGF